MTPEEIESLVSKVVQKQIAEQIEPVVDAMTDCLDYAHWMRQHVGFPIARNGVLHASSIYLDPAGQIAWQKINDLRKKFGLSVSPCQHARGVGQD